MNIEKPANYVLLVALLVAFAGQSAAADSFYSKLKADCRVSASGIDAHSLVGRLEEAHGIAVWLDRRVDHSVVSLPPEPISVEATLSDIARKLNADVAFTDSFVIIAPKGKADVAASMILRLRGQMRMSGSPVAKRLLSRHEIRWGAVSTPTEILASYVKKWNLSVQTELPHDLWAAKSLGEVDAATALVLLCSGFDVLPVVADRNGSFKLYQAPTYVAADVRYPSARLSASKLAEVSAIDIAAKFKEQGGMTLVTANAEAHHFLKTSNANVKRDRQAKPVVDALSNSFTLRVPGAIPVQAVLENICKKCAVTLDVKQASTKRLETRIALDFEDTLVTKILTDVCNEADLDVQFTDDTVIVSDRPEP